MLAIELSTAELAKAALIEMTRRKILINRTSETVLRFLPPYILGMGDVKTAVDALGETLAGISPAELATATHMGGGIAD